MAVGGVFETDPVPWRLRVHVHRRVGIAVTIAVAIGNAIHVVESESVRRGSRTLLAILGVRVTRIGGIMLMIVVGVTAVVLLLFAKESCHSYVVFS